MKKIFTIVSVLFAGIAAISQPTQPGTPLACNSSNCTAPLSETCAPGSSTVVTDFRNGTLFSGTPLLTGAVYRFGNIATVSGRQVNATVTVDAVYQSILASIDDDAATDQNNNSVTSFFAPRISPDLTLGTTSRRGYVQFTIRFFKNVDLPLSNNDFDSVAILTNLNYIHYDIDGNTIGTGGWFRETGLIKSVSASSINADASTELVSYNYPDGGFNWKGFAGTVCERTGLSRCAQVAAAASFSAPQTEVTVRLGYDYNRTTANGDFLPVRQYGTRFGCFSFPTTITLPVKLNSFSGYFNNGNARLFWQTEQELNFSHFELERSLTGSDFSKIESVNATGGSTIRQYQYTDMQVTSPIAYYRLKMVDKNGAITYSNIVALRKDAGTVSGISVSPNPTRGDRIQVSLNATTNSRITVKVIDGTGKQVIQQQEWVSPGMNNITISNLQQLQPGLYIVQAGDNGEVQTTRFVLAR